MSPQQLVEHALDAARGDCVVAVHDASRANLRWAGNTLTTNGVTHDVSVTVVAFHPTGDGTAAGSVTGSATTAEEVTALVAAAEADAASAEPAEDAAPLVGSRTSADWDDASPTTGVDTYAGLAPALGRAFATAAAADRLLYGFVNHELVTTYLGSTSGLRLRHVQPTGHLGCTGKSADLTRSAWVGRATRDFTDVDPAAVEAELAQRLAWAERTVDLPAGRYDTILPPSAVADLMVDVYWGAGARTAHEGQSVYSRPPADGGGTRVGDRIVAPGVRLWSDPAAPGLESAPFVVASSSSNTSSVFDNGLPLARTDWIADGVLSHLVGTRHSTALTGLPTTPYVDNLVLEVDGGAGDVADLVAGTERGLLLTCLWYIREVDPQRMLLTGLTRDGVYLVEDGEITGAVNNFRFNESPVELLSRFSHASASAPSFGREWGDDYFSRTATPALRVPDFTMSSVSQAR